MKGMASIVWLVPLLPLLAAGMTSLLPRAAKRASQALAIGAMAAALGLALATFASTLGGEGSRAAANFAWFRLGSAAMRLGFVVDPLGALMLVMVSFVGLLIFVFSTGYMAHDANVTRFFCFLSLFAAAMLGLVIANSLLLVFACWELMGLASYLLIGFWFERPSAAAAARKAVIVTRIGDLGLLLGMLWLYRETGTLLFFDGGRGCLEAPALAALTTTMVAGSVTAATAIALLIFVGAVGKSGQVPLHVWLPDAMEGPTPVSALIHAATMVAAGVFLVARVFPLFAGAGMDGAAGASGSPALNVVTAVGAITAVFGALIAVGQSDIKRILAYSTVSQLGYMFLGLGTGGVAVGMFHLITHAFFKALLFLGAGSVIHGCGDEQDIRRMGGLRRLMPVTFATYAVGMMALSGVPLLFSGFWSKDEILHAAWGWAPSRWPFVLGLVGALLTAFYMTRQMAQVFFGTHRGAGGADSVHESPRSMTVPLVVLAVFAVGLGFIGTPAWPWFEAYLEGHAPVFDPHRFVHALPMMGVSTVVVAIGLGLGWRVYGRRLRQDPAARDPLEGWWAGGFAALRGRFFVDELYEATFVRAHRIGSSLVLWMDGAVIGGVVLATGWIFRALAFVVRSVDELLVNAGFDSGCGGVRLGGRGFAGIQNGRAQRYLGVLALGMAVLTAAVVWGLKS